MRGRSLTALATMPPGPKTISVGDVREFEASTTVGDQFCDGWRSLSPVLFPGDDHRGKVSGHSEAALGKRGPRLGVVSVSPARKRFAMGCVNRDKVFAPCTAAEAPRRVLSNFAVKIRDELASDNFPCVGNSEISQTSGDTNASLESGMASRFEGRSQSVLLRTNCRA